MDLPPRRGIPSPGSKRERERERLAPLANNATLCALYASTLLQDASFRCRESGDPSIPPKREETRVGGVGIPPSTGINGNRRSNRVFFQLMARMIGDELLEDGGGGEASEIARTRVFW